MITENEQLVKLLRELTPEFQAKVAKTFKTHTQNQINKNRTIYNTDIVKNVIDSIIVELQYPDIKS